MTGPEHYKRAEQLLEGRPATPAEMMNGGPQGGRWTPGTSDIAKAKVHALLAQTAAIALGAGEVGLEPHEHHAWNKVAGTSTEVGS